MGTACCNFIVYHLEEVCVCVSSLTHYLHLFFSHIVVWEHNMWSCAWERLIIQRVVLTSDGLAIADASLLWFNVTYSSGFSSFVILLSVCWKTKWWLTCQNKAYTVWNSCMFGYILFLYKRLHWPFWLSEVLLFMIFIVPNDWFYIYISHAHTHFIINIIWNIIIHYLKYFT